MNVASADVLGGLVLLLIVPIGGIWLLALRYQHDRIVQVLREDHCVAWQSTGSLVPLKAGGSILLLLKSASAIRSALPDNAVVARKLRSFVATFYAVFGVVVAVVASFVLGVFVK